MKKKVFIFVISIMFLGFAQVVSALVINEDFDSSPDRWSLNGSAYWNSGYIVLTPDSQGKRGSVWYKEIFDLNNFSQFVAEFDIYLGSRDWCGADGITFAIIDVSNGLNALGGGGGGFGYIDINNSIAVEFDTYSNSNVGDPNGDHIGIDKDGSISSLIYARTANLEDNKWHHALVSFDIKTNSISVNLDNNPYIQNYIFSNLALSEVYFGFTGATGYFHNKQSIDNFRLTLEENPVPEPSTFLLLGSAFVCFFLIRKGGYK